MTKRMTGTLEEWRAVRLGLPEGEGAHAGIDQLPWRGQDHSAADLPSLQPV
jgi:hypothetical protein